MLVVHFNMTHFTADTRLLIDNGVMTGKKMGRIHNCVSRVELPPEQNWLDLSCVSWVNRQKRWPAISCWVWRCNWDNENGSTSVVYRGLDSQPGQKHGSDLNCVPRVDLQLIQKKVGPIAYRGRSCNKDKKGRDRQLHVEGWLAAGIKNGSVSCVSCVDLHLG